MIYVRCLCGRNTMNFESQCFNVVPTTRTNEQRTGSKFECVSNSVGNMVNDICNTSYFGCRDNLQIDSQMITNYRQKHVIWQTVSVKWQTVSTICNTQKILWQKFSTIIHCLLYNIYLKYQSIFIPPDLNISSMADSRIFLP